MGSATDLEGQCLRYGVLYGPGTAFAEGVSLLDRVRKHRLPVVGGGTGVWLTTMIRGSSNAKARAELGWVPVYQPVQREGLWAREHPQSFALMPVCHLARVALLSRQGAGHSVAVLRHDAPKGRGRPRVGVQPGLGCVSQLTAGQCHRIEALDNGLGDRVGP